MPDQWIRSHSTPVLSAFNHRFDQCSDWRRNFVPRFHIRFWAFILNQLLQRFHSRMLGFWIANVMAALAFSAGHLGTIMILTHSASISDLSPMTFVEIFLLNGVIGLFAGWRYMKDGLVAASGVHFWSDVVFHVIYGLM